MPQRIWIPLLLLIAGLAGIGIGRVVLPPAIPPDLPIELESGTWLSPPRPVPDFRLVDQDGAAAGPEALRGRWSLLFFGFTNCPEACPTTLATLGTVRSELAAGQPGAQVPSIVLVSVDPERDTPAVLKAYLAGFGAGLTGLTGDPAAVAAFASALGVPYRKIPMDDGYMMDHSTAVMLVDPRGELAAIFTGPQEAESLLRDVRRSVAAR